MYKILTILFFFTTLTANNTPNNNLESILQDATDTVTQKSLNVDYLPSVTTVIYAQTFMDAGVQTVGEAIGMVPGIQMQLNFIGQPIISVRGFTSPDSMLSDKIKILVDGVTINNEASGSSGFYMDLPIHLVQRIEVLRGPGSTVYGAGAFFGAINIITKLGNENQENRLFVGLGSYQYKTTAANLHTKSGNWKIFTDAYYAQNDKSLSTSDEAMQSLSLGFKLANGGFEFLTRYKESDYGNFFQNKGDLEPNYDKGHKESYFFSQLSYKMISNDFQLETKGSFSRRESDIAAYFTTDVDQIAQVFNVVDIDMQEAFHVRDHQVEKNIELQTILTLPRIFSNNISINVGGRRADLTTNSFTSSVETAIAQNLDSIVAHPNYSYFPFRQEYEPAYWDNPTSTALFRKTQRTILYASFEDLISLNKDVDFVLGARVDNYSDIGSQISTRAGLVYRASDELIAKLLYGSAFRAPSFYEKYTSGHIYYGYGVQSLVPEKTNTYEAALIYMPNLQNKLSLNVYYSKLMNVIDNDHSSDNYVGYVQMKDRVNKGVEFEYYFKTKEIHDIFFNATYVDAQYTYPNTNPPLDQSMPDISKVMLKAIYIYHPTSMLSFGSLGKYYSPTTQNEKIPRDTTVDKQYIFDETITYKFAKASQIRLSIKNIFNTEVRIPSNSYKTPGGELREGRNYFLNYTYIF